MKLKFLTISVILTSLLCLESFIKLYAQNIIPFLTKQGEYTFVFDNLNTYPKNKNKYKTINDLHNGFFSFTNSAGPKAKFGLIRNGVEIHKQFFSFIAEMSENIIVALDTLNMLYLIDSTGKTTNTSCIIKMEDWSLCKYLKFYNGILLVKNIQNNLYAFDKNGKNLFTIMDIEEFYPFSGEFSAIKTKNSSGYKLLNKSGKYINTNTYDFVCYLGNDLFVFSKNNKYGFIKNDGLEYLYDRFDEIEYLNKNYNGINIIYEVLNFKTQNYPINTIRIKENEVYGYLDEDLNYLVPPKYKEAGLFRGNYALATNDNQSFDIIDKNGHIIKSFFLPDIQKEGVFISSNFILYKREILWLDTLNFNIHPLAKFPFQHRITSFSDNYLLNTVFLVTEIDSLINGFFIKNVNTMKAFAATPLSNEGGGSPAGSLLMLTNNDWVGYHSKRNWGEPGIFWNSKDMLEFNEGGFQKAICATHDKWFFINKSGVQYRDSILFEINNPISIKLKKSINEYVPPPPPPPPPPISGTHKLIKNNRDIYQKAKKELNLFGSLDEIKFYLQSGKIHENKYWPIIREIIDVKTENILLFQSKYLPDSITNKNLNSAPKIWNEHNGIKSSYLTLAKILDKLSFLNYLLNNIPGQLNRTYPQFEIND